MGAKSKTLQGLCRVVCDEKGELTNGRGSKRARESAGMTFVVYELAVRCRVRPPAPCAVPAAPRRSSRGTAVGHGSPLVPTTAPRRLGGQLHAASSSHFPPWCNLSVTTCARSLQDARPVRCCARSILISAKPPDEQKLWIGGITAGLLVSTVLIVTLLSAVESALPAGWFGTLGNLGSVPLGLVFAALGAAHFAKKETFLGIVPPLGTWGGLWQVPAPGAENLGLSYAEYHTYWSGAAELLGGLLLAASGVGLVPVAVQQFDAFLMLLLTLAVTPANIYMATHDAQMEGGPPPMAYPDAHIFGRDQAALLAGFWKLAFH